MVLTTCVGTTAAIFRLAGALAGGAIRIAPPYFAVILLEGLAVMGLSIAICSAAGVTAAVLEDKANEEIARWGYWGTAVGFVFGMPLTLSAFVLLGRSG